MDSSWNGLEPIQANAVEEKQIQELMHYNPKLDYLMALMLVKASDQDLEAIIAEKQERPLPRTSTIIENAFTVI